MAAAAALGMATNGHASAVGTLGNFDVVNDTGHDCHGFEIELEDLHPADVPYTFGGSYSRYGAPEVLDTTVDPAHPRVLIRYRRWNGTAWEATPVAPAGVTPSGHDCYQGGPIGNYLDSGCEHYGASLGANPTRTTYRWLVAASPSDPNTAFTTAPEQVQLPVPVWNVVAQPAGGVVVQAEVEPVEEEHHAQRGEPQWMKVYKVKSDLDLQPQDLDRLLFGLADGLAPDSETEIETEWRMIQSKPGNAEGAEEDADVREDPLDAGERSVLRRYEFYRYTGPRDPENNEALPCIADDAPVPDDAPVDGCSDLGDFVGAQNVAVDLGLATTNAALPAAEVGVAYPDTPLVVGGLPPYTVQVTGGALPAGLDVDALTGILFGTPTAAGVFTFDVQASDAAGAVAAGSFAVTVTEDLCPDDPDKLLPGACGCGVPESACADLCPDDGAKTEPGVCGCGVADDDTNANGVADCLEPGRADLAAGVRQITAAARVQAGKRLKYELRVTNLGPDPVLAATIDATLAGGPFSAVKLPKGCTGTPEAITCAITKLTAGKSKRKTLSLVPAAGASIAVRAQVSSAVVDPVAANQSAAVTTTLP